MKMNAYKDFHIFACMSVIKTCVTDLVLKDKNAQKLLKVFFIFFANCFNVLMILFFSLMILSNLGYFLHNLKILILKMMVV